VFFQVFFFFFFLRIVLIEKFSPGGGGWGSPVGNGTNKTPAAQVASATKSQFLPRGSVHNWNQTAEGI
jgi:hypothetical protein